MRFLASIKSYLKSVFSLYTSGVLFLLFYPVAVGLCINSDSLMFSDFISLAVWHPILYLSLIFLKHNNIQAFLKAIYFVFGLINIFHFTLLSGPVSASSLVILLSTNFSEVSEFLISKFNFYLLLELPFIFGYISTLYQPKSFSTNVSFRRVLCIFIIISSFYIGRRVYMGAFVNFALPQPVRAMVVLNIELQGYLSTEQSSAQAYTATSSIPDCPQLVLVVIGESANRDMHSLYGYSQPTNPRLSQRPDLYILDSVRTPYSHTIAAVLTSLITAKANQKKLMYSAPNVIKAFAAAGFSTYWISNQCPIGIWDNPVMNLAKQAGERVFVNQLCNNSSDVGAYKSFDDKVLSPLHYVFSKNESKQVIFIHLLGSHMDYSCRYPENFAFFSGNTLQKRVTSHYLNSIRYTDFIVDSVFSSFQKHCKTHGIAGSAIYYSDHGENVYHFNNTVGHDHTGLIPDYLSEIPYIMTVSEAFKSTFPLKDSILKARGSVPFSSENMFHVLLGLGAIDCSLYEPDADVFAH